SLSSGKADLFLKKAKEKNITLSLTIDSGDSKTIESFIATPSANAKRLVKDSLPIMKKYGFSDLNLDIEYTSDANNIQRKEFVNFLRAVRKNLPNQYSLTLEISTLDVIRNQLIDIKSVSSIADNIVLMAYDYHASNSFVIGPVAPLNGAGIDSEYDVATAVEKALQFIPSQKLILGIPLYGYEWEALGTTPRLAAIPGSGVADSNFRAETFLESCATCSAKLDINADEPYFEFFSDESNTNHIIFYPNQNTTKSKIDFANKNALGGIALWALGYEGNTILNPLSDYINKNQ
ncbi:MAG: hypothetical protein KGL95_14595, partial [Patescibacteria group bacterium]|nr:hypothetical protein [Patescibacteria group bacterium]